MCLYHLSYFFELKFKSEIISHKHLSSHTKEECVHTTNNVSNMIVILCDDVVVAIFEFYYYKIIIIIILIVFVVVNAVNIFFHLPQCFMRLAFFQFQL